MGKGNSCLRGDLRGTVTVNEGLPPRGRTEDPRESGGDPRGRNEGLPPRGDRRFVRTGDREKSSGSAAGAAAEPEEED